MPTVQAQVAQANLATAIGVPNAVSTQYSTEVLLPVSGPVEVGVIVKQWTWWLADLFKFLAFADHVAQHIAAGRPLALHLRAPVVVDPYAPGTAFDNRIVRNARAAWREMTERLRIASAETGRMGTVADHNARLQAAFMRPVPRSERRVNVRSIRRGALSGVDANGRQLNIGLGDAERSAAMITDDLAHPTRIFRDAFDAGILRPTPTLFADPFLQANGRQRAIQLLNALIVDDGGPPLEAVTGDLANLIIRAIDDAKDLCPPRTRPVLSGANRPLRDLLAQWLVLRHVRFRSDAPSLLGANLDNVLGFTPLQVHPEWALRREEWIDLTFGQPDLVGPFNADGVPPQGSVRQKEFDASENELSLLVGETRQEGTSEGDVLTANAVRGALGAVYYSGPGTVQELTSDASNDAMFFEERRSVVHSLLQEISRTHGRSELARTRRVTSLEKARKAVGIDAKLAATHHRFHVRVPVHATIRLEDVGLTWCPRLDNPFMHLRSAVREEYDRAYAEYMMQNYVTVPVAPPIDWESFTVQTTCEIEGHDNGRDNAWFTIDVQNDAIIDGVDIRHTRADLARYSVTYESEGSAFENDPDTWNIYCTDLRANDPLTQITGKVVFETTDTTGEESEGTATISIPVLRYSPATMNALAQFDAQQQDYERKVQAIQARAAQYARIKRREMIERYEDFIQTRAIVFDILMRRVCSAAYRPAYSYYAEVIRRCIDWENAKLVFEARPMNDLIYTDFAPDHFMNSPGARLFLPVRLSAETVFLDTLQECGTAAFRASLAVALNEIDALRQRLLAQQDNVIQEFDDEFVIGDHLEAVVSNYDFGS